MDRLHVHDSSSRDCGAIQWERLIDRPSDLAETCNKAQHVILNNEDIRKLRLADPGRMLGDRGEHRLNIAG